LNPSWRLEQQDLEWVDPYLARFVSNETLYHNPISRQLAVQVWVQRDKPSYVICQNKNEFRCISKFFQDLFEEYVFASFNRVEIGFEVPVECGVPVEEAAANRLKSEVEAAGDDAGTAAMDWVDSKV
jgi:hypothetical protein